MRRFDESSAQNAKTLIITDPLLAQNSTIDALQIRIKKIQHDNVEPDSLVENSIQALEGRCQEEDAFQGDE